MENLSVCDTTEKINEMTEELLKFDIAIVLGCGTKRTKNTTREQLVRVNEEFCEETA